MHQISLFNFEEDSTIAQPDKQKPKKEKVFVEEKIDEVMLPVVDESPREIEFLEKEIISNTSQASQKPTGAPTKRTGRGRRSMKELAATAHHTQVPPDEILFSKQYYPISAVAEMFNENISLIRFWENEFDILKPKKNGKGNRLFRPQDIKNLEIIYTLLREQKYTIEGAQDYMKRNKKREETFLMMDELNKIKGFLLELRSSL